MSEMNFLNQKVTQACDPCSLYHIQVHTIDSVGVETDLMVHFKSTGRNPAETVLGATPNVKYPLEAANLDQLSQVRANDLYHHVMDPAYREHFESGVQAKVNETLKNRNFEVDSVVLTGVKFSDIFLAEKQKEKDAQDNLLAAEKDAAKAQEALRNATKQAPK